MLLDLKNKTIILTGGSGYLGTPLAKLLVNEVKRLIVVGRKQLSASEVAHHFASEAVEYISCDLTDEKSLETLNDSIGNSNLLIDGLVNAAYFSSFSGLKNTSPSEWSKGIDGSLNINYNAIHYLLPFFKTGSSIVNISSMYGIVAPVPEIYPSESAINPINYGVGKAGLIHLTKQLAVHLAKQGIRVNSISPGAFPDPIKNDPEFVKKLESKIPLAKVGKPEDLFGPVTFLLSDASSYITGHNLVVDGGWTIW